MPDLDLVSFIEHCTFNFNMMFLGNAQEDDLPAVERTSKESVGFQQQGQHANTSSTGGDSK